MSTDNSSFARQVLYGRTDERLRATWRVVLSFAVFLSTLIAASTLFGRIPFPELLLSAGSTLAVFLAVGVLLVVGIRFVGQRSLDSYGLSLDRRWWLDAAGGVIAGFLFQGVVTALLFAFGSGRLVGTFSPGVADGPVTVAVAFGATVLALLAVALWEELLFRGVLIQNTLEGLAARGVTRRTGVGIALLGSALVFGLPHATAAAEGASVGFAVFQAVVAGLYFGLAYLLTDSLAFPIGLHLSTNLWVASVFGQPDSAFPALLLLERDLQADPEGVAVVLVPSVVLVGLIIAWVRLTRGDVSVADSLSLPPGGTPDEAIAD